LFQTQRDTVIREDVNAAKSNFLEIISHELNTLMNGILGCLEFLQNTGLSAEQVEYVSTIRDCSLKYFEHVEDILTDAKLSMSERALSSSSFNPATMLLKLTSEEEADVPLQIEAEIPEDLPQYVSGAKREIRVVLRKLIHNALKFAPDGDVRVAIRFEYLSAATIRLSFEVSDCGPGIDPAYIESGKIFDVFSPGDSSLARRDEGLGLGLALCKSISDRLGGSLEVESELGQGSRFTFSVDVREEGA
jgi:signal transduction histidine kinase